MEGSSASNAKYVGNKIPRQFHNFFSLPQQCCQKKKKKNVKDSVETFVYYIGNGFSIPRHFAKDYDLVFK